MRRTASLLFLVLVAIACSNGSGEELTAPTTVPNTVVPTTAVAPTTTEAAPAPSLATSVPRRPGTTVPRRPGTTVPRSPDTTTPAAPYPASPNDAVTCVFRAFLAQEHRRGDRVLDLIGPGARKRFHWGTRDGPEGLEEVVDRPRADESWRYSGFWYDN
jgi:hypothetical protein